MTDRRAILAFAWTIGILMLSGCGGSRLVTEESTGTSAGGESSAETSAPDPETNDAGETGDEGADGASDTSETNDDSATDDGETETPEPEGESTSDSGGETATDTDSDSSNETTIWLAVAAGILGLVTGGFLVGRSSKDTPEEDEPYEASLRHEQRQRQMAGSVLAEARWVDGQLTRLINSDYSDVAVDADTQERTVKAETDARQLAAAASEPLSSALTDLARSLASCREALDNFGLSPQSQDSGKHSRLTPEQESNVDDLRSARKDLETSIVVVSKQVPYL